MAESQRTDLHEWLLDRYGPKGESLYMLANGLVAISDNGFAALLLNQPLLFPSLSPTVFTLFRQPLTPQASPRNTIVGHFVAITVGFFFLLVFGLRRAERAPGGRDARAHRRSRWRSWRRS